MFWPSTYSRLTDVISPSMMCASTCVRERRLDITSLAREKSSEAVIGLHLDRICNPRCEWSSANRTLPVSMPSKCEMVPNVSPFSW